MGDSAFAAVSPPLAEHREDPPFAREAVVLSKLEYVELKSQRNFYKAQHERVLAREASLKKLERERVKVRDLNQRFTLEERANQAQ